MQLFFLYFFELNKLTYLIKRANQYYIYRSFLSLFKTLKYFNISPLYAEQANISKKYVKTTRYQTLAHNRKNRK